MRKRMVSALMAGLICFGSTAVPASAMGQEPEPLTPEGNMTLVDDVDGADRQFITVTSKNGNVFYIIIDRAGEGENTVHFLNQVDEADLLGLMGEEAPPACSCTSRCEAGAVNTACELCAVNMGGCAGKAPEPAAEPEPEPEKKSSPAPLLAVVGLLALVGGGAFYWFKLRRKPEPKPDPDADDDFEEDSSKN